MTTHTVTFIFALLAIFGFASAAVIVLVRLFAPAVFFAWRARLGTTTLVLAAIAATIAVGGSLYLSEVAHFPPCKLCWYQRIAMYPLPIALWIAVWRDDRGIRPYVIVPAAIGSVISIWHVLIEHYPSLETTTTCDVSNPCGVIWVRQLHYFTIPTMALAGFWFIIAMVSLCPPRRTPVDWDDDEELISAAAP
jgi:disulfide bond formation protein DsbB